MALTNAVGLMLVSMTMTREISFNGNVLSQMLFELAIIFVFSGLMVMNLQMF